MSKVISFSDLSSTNELPLPEKIAREYRFHLSFQDVRRTRYYVIRHWIFGIVPSRKPDEIWSALKRHHPDIYKRCVQLPHVVDDGTSHPVVYADAETLYLITQHMEANSGYRDDILLYLAKAGVVLDEMIRDPAKAEEMFAELANRKDYRNLLDEDFSHEEATQWIEARRSQKDEWNKIRGVWKACDVKEGFEYARLTNDVQKCATGKSATAAKTAMRIKGTSREFLSAAENTSIGFVSMASRILHAQRGSKGVEELSEDIQDVKPIIDAARPEIEKVFSKKRRRLPPTNAR